MIANPSVCMLGVFVCVDVPVWLGFCHLISFKKLKSDYNQTAVKYAMWVPSSVIEVKVFCVCKRSITKFVVTHLLSPIKQFCLLFFVFEWDW